MDKIQLYSVQFISETLIMQIRGRYFYHYGLYVDNIDTIPQVQRTIIVRNLVNKKIRHTYFFTQVQKRNK